MSVAIITGSSGLVGSESVKYFHSKGMEVVGVDNDMRAYFFGAEASTRWNTERLSKSLKNFRAESLDIRDQQKIFALFRSLGKEVSLVVHTAAQPSHDWAAKEPFTDFSVNATGTLNLLEATRQFCPAAVFIFTSTNKVYGDTPNFLPLVEMETRWEVDPSHAYARYGIDETMSIDQSKHSLFGASKVAADVLVQEYGRYFGLKTGVFRGGCLTGPAHSGAELHGFLAYLVLCAQQNRKYTIYGYQGKQVRDNIHSADLVRAFDEFHRSPKPGAVYNIGGSRYSNCSVLEAIRMVEEMTGQRMEFEVSPHHRSGDHIWWISDVRRFQTDYPSWKHEYGLKEILVEIIEASCGRSRKER